MKKFFIILILSLFVDLAYSQECKDSFEKQILQSYKSSKESFFKKSSKCLKRHNKIGEYDIVAIPNVLTKKNVRLIPLKSELLCFIVPKLNYDQSLVFMDSIFLGIIYNYEIDNKRMFCDSSYKELYKSTEPLAQFILEHNPDLVFTVYNLPNSYWFFTNGKLSVLTFENNGYNEEHIWEPFEYLNTLKDDKIMGLFMLKKKTVKSN